MLSTTAHLPLFYRFHPLFSGDGGPAIDQIPQLPPIMWVAMISSTGGAEQFRIAKGWAPLDPVTNKAPNALRPGYAPGDLVRSFFAAMRRAVRVERGSRQTHSE